MIALAPIALLFVAWVAHPPSSAALTWVFRGPARPYPTQGPPLKDGHRWFRTLPPPVDPWGQPFYVDDPLDEDATVCSAGPDGVFELNKGDDIQVAGFFFLGWGGLWVLLVVGGFLCSGLVAVVYVTWRQAAAPRSARLEVELARAAVISLPVVVAGLCLLLATGLGRAAARSSSAHVAPWLAVTGSLAFAVYVAVLGLRVRRPRADAPDDAARIDPADRST